MIARVLAPGARARDVLRRLYRPGACVGFPEPHLVAGWRPPAQAEPPRAGDGHRDLTRLAGLMEAPLALLEPARRPDRPVWHCIASAAPEDPVLGDDDWAEIAREIMSRTGLDISGTPETGVPWIAVRTGPRHVHVAAVLVRADGRRAYLYRDYFRLAQAARWAEKRYGLRNCTPSGPRRPTRAETDKAARLGLPEPPRITVRRHVEEAAAQAATEEEFFQDLDRRGLAVRLRRSPDGSGVDGYAAGLPGDTSSSGQVYFGGRKLSPGLSLTSLRERWAAQPES